MVFGIKWIFITKNMIFKKKLSGEKTLFRVELVVLVTNNSYEKVSFDGNHL